MSEKPLTIRSREDIIRFVNNNPVSQRGFMIILVALGGVFVDAYDFASLGIGADQLKEEFNLGPAQLGSVTAIMAFGAMLGAIFGGYYTDKFGRNKMFFIDLLFLVVASLGAALSPNLTWLLVFRFLMGVGVGLDLPIALSFIAEFSGSKQKGKYVNLWQPLWYIAASCTGLVILPFYLYGVEQGLWRWAIGFGAVAALIVLMLRHKYMDESPMWAANNLSLKDAARVIEKTYNIKTIVMEEKENELPIRPVNKHIPFSTIFEKKYRIRTLLASIITSTQSMQYFAVGFYLPSISVLLLGKGVMNAIIGTVLFNIFGIIGGFTQSFLTDRFGIRKLTIIGYSIAAACLLLVGLTGDGSSVYWSALLIGGFIFGHSFGPGSQGMSMATLSYPTELRGLGSGWGQGMVRVGSMCGFFFFPIVLASAGLTKTLLYLTIVPVIGLLSVLLIKWDPIGKDIEEEGFDSNKQNEQANNKEFAL